MMGWLGVALLVVMLALFVVTLWSLSLRPVRREEPADPFVVIPMGADSLVPRRVVVMSEDPDGVFRAS